VREQFRAELVGIPAEQLVYLAETGLDNPEARASGWSPPGEPCGGEKPGSRTQRVSLIAALPHHTLRTPLVFEGTCNPRLFEA
jgi:hypothetical protein